ncbi:MAG: glucosamine-6-phosphate deaminase [Candidatus Sumerlaeota bacterium]
MKVHILENKEELGLNAGKAVAEALRDTIKKNGEAFFLTATGASMFETYEQLTKEEVAWSSVTIFHLDEYIGIDDTHPASFRRYLKERFVDKLPGLRAFHQVRGDAEDIKAECERLGALISEVTIDVAQVGIGENGHLAFNDPPADFETTEPYIVVELDEACRRQQYGEGWFESMEDVPKKAVSMSIREIMRAEKVLVVVPDERKAQAVKDCLEGTVDNRHPASILQEHDDCTVFLDRNSASLLEEK